MPSPVFATLRAAGLCLAGSLVLASCVVVEEVPRPLPPLPPDDDRICTREYDPVCGQRRGERQTFGNACVARAEGFRVVYPGECRRDRPDWDRPQFCTQEYRPVCAVRGNRQRTFGNACEAETAGWRIRRPGEC